MIPRIIHQTWRDRQLPENFARWSAQWRALHPHWEYRLHDDADMLMTIEQRAPQWRATFEALPRMIQRVDMFRYLIVWLDGGLYADLDMVPYRPSDELLTDARCVLAVEHCVTPWRQRALGFARPWQFQNCIFAAEPGHPFLLALMERIGELAQSHIGSDDAVEDTTGPRMLTRLAYALPPEKLVGIKALPEIVWSGSWLYPRVWPLGHQIHARHASTGTWRRDHRGLMRRIASWNYPQNPLARSGPRLP